MNQSPTGLDDDAAAIVREEEELLARALAAIERARVQAAKKAGVSEMRSVQALRALREEATATSADDLPGVLHEMSVRHQLIERPPGDRLPDPEAPYLAHLRVDEAGSVKDYLLGHATLLDTAAGVRVVDWRVAPVAQIFYRYREGDEYEEDFPGRTAEGRVLARRIVVIERGEVTQIVADGILLARRADGGWERLDRAALALDPGGAGTAARPATLGIGIGGAQRAKGIDVTALLDADQYAAVCAPADEPLLVLGSAGSGKTTVALHRLARIAARAPERLTQMKVVVPEEGLARLSRRFLEPLGASAAQVQTLDQWSSELARSVFAKKIALCTDAPGLVSSLKRHPAMYRALRARFATLKEASTTLPRLRRRLADVLTDRAFLGGVVDASRGDLPRTAIEATVEHTMLQLAEPIERHLATITDAARKRALDGRAIREGTPDELAGTLDVEDLPILLFLKAWRSTLVGAKGAAIAHLVLDEAEDFSLFELFAMQKLLAEPRSVTLAGDEAQQTASSFAGWDASLAELGARGASTCRLSVSYRCPRPVADLAHRLLGALAHETPARVLRDGAPIGDFHFPSEAPAHLFLAGALRDLVAREPRASVAVIARSAEAARSFHALVADVPEARLVIDGAFTFEPGIDVTHVDDAKGLEFDYVVVPDATDDAYPATDEARRRLYVAVTRASHQLWIVAGGRRSPLLESRENARTYIEAPPDRRSRSGSALGA
jgi:DNA helicase IV